MAHVYVEFDTTPGGLVAALKTNILTSSEWSNPTGNVLKATSTLGAQMVIDLTGGGAVETFRMRPLFWRAHNGTTGTDSHQRTIYWSRNSNGGSGNITTTSPIHVRLAAGPTLLYFDIEGPRVGEQGYDNNILGCRRQFLFISQITPYFGTDTVPAVVVGGCSSYPGYENQSPGDGSVAAWVSRNAADSASWQQSRILTLAFQYAVPTNSVPPQHQTYSSIDGNYYMAPYVVFEDLAGIRGRLTDLFNLGGVYASSLRAGAAPQISVGQIVTAGSNTYKAILPVKMENDNADNCLAVVSNSVGGSGPILAVRKT